MKKIGLILMSGFLIAVVFQSCTDDQSALTDPRDAIAKMWRVTEDGTGQSYDVTITKDPTELTKVWFENFHNLGSSEKVYATLASSILTIPQQTTASDYTIDGEGTISSDKISFEYSVAEGSDPKEDFTSTFGTVVTAKKKLLAFLSK